MSNIQSVKRVYNEVQKIMSEASQAFPWDNKDAYLAWLVDTYCYAQNTTRILAGIGYRLPIEKTQLSNRFVAHAAEEKGHERLLENDVKAFDLTIQNLEPTVIGQAFHQSLYYWLTAGNPLGIFGWVLTLEGFAIVEGPRLYEVCTKVFGPKATSFLKVHSVEDIDHVDKAFKILENLSSDEYKVIEAALRFQGELYCKVLNDIANSVSGAKKHRKAA